MADRRKRPISPEQATEEIAAVGKVSSLAKIAALDLGAQLADAQAVRLRREVLRTAVRYGKGSKETIEAEQRIRPHDSFRRALKIERARARVPIPPAPATGSMAYGRVFTSDGKPAAKAVVEAIEARGDKVLGRGEADAKGFYTIPLDVKGTADLCLRARGTDTGAAATIGDPLRLAEGGRVQRDLRLSAKGDEEPTSTPTPTPTPRTTMPNLVGTAEARARATLEKLGITKISVSTVETSTVPAGQVAKQSPKAGTAITEATTVELVVAAADIVVPDLRRQTLEQATVTLNRVGLQVGEIRGERQNTVVTDQKPAAGQKAAAGTSIALELAKPG
jgi:hypothetical protein